jgi:hypothetical protein
MSEDTQHASSKPVPGDSGAVVLARGHHQGRHSHHRADLSRYAPFDQPIPQISGAGYLADPISIRSFHNATLFRRYGIAKNENGVFIRETLVALDFRNPQWRTDGTIVNYHAPPESVMSGNVVYASHGNYPVYSHFLFETACTCYLLRHLFPRGDLSLIIPTEGQTWSHQILDLLEVPRERRIAFRNRQVRVDNLLLSTTCSGRNTFRPNKATRDMASYLIDKAKPSRNNGRKRLYLTRGGFQNTSNRDYLEDRALSELLAGIGFHTLNPGTLSFREQIEVFANAEIVVGAHGSAFANLMFAPRGCVVIDLLPSTWAAAGGEFTANVTNLFEHCYIYLIGETRRTVSGTEMSLDPGDVYQTVRKILKH